MIQVILRTRLFLRSANDLRSSVVQYRLCSTSTKAHHHTGKVEELLNLSKFLVDKEERKQSPATEERYCKRFCSTYRQLDKSESVEYLQELALSTKTDKTRVKNVASLLIESQAPNKIAKLEEELRSSLIPPVNKIFSKIGQTRGGVKFLVDMRADLVTWLRSSDPTTQEHKNLQDLSKTLRSLLAVWMSVGFMSLSRVTWDSPSSLLQKISDYEAVHPLRSWMDLKGRVGPYRRVFVYTHPCMPAEPLVVLHVALTSQISSSMSSLVREFRSVNNLRSPRSDDGAFFDSEDEIGDCDTAIFYSITSTQPGLQGIELGNHLIKQAVSELQRELPGLKRFSTLSPIPGFRGWLLLELTRSIEGQCDSPLLPHEIQALKDLSPTDDDLAGEEIMRQSVKTNSWVGDNVSEPILKPILLRLCARYLYKQKRRSKSLDPVANFHIRNGAVLYRINWLADPSPRGLTNSCGLMVNYRYYLEDVEQNSTDYIRDDKITAHQQVLDIVE